jgi:hypothetical protein
VEILIFKGLSARRLYKSFGVRGLTEYEHEATKWDSLKFRQLIYSFFFISFESIRLHQKTFAITQIVSASYIRNDYFVLLAESAQKTLIYWDIKIEDGSLFAISKDNWMTYKLLVWSSSNKCTEIGPSQCLIWVAIIFFYASHFYCLSSILLNSNICSHSQILMIRYDIWYDTIRYDIWYDIVPMLMTSAYSRTRNINISVNITQYTSALTSFHPFLPPSQPWTSVTC